MQQIHTPDWVKDAVFYQIFPDRFAIGGALENKPANLEPWDAPPGTFGFKGGDLYGIAERLEYLRDLGITALYLNPIFQSPANHRYHTQDYYRVDPILGGDAAFDQLVQRAHALGIRIVLDGVFNHTGRGFYQFQHALENGSASPYVDWFHFDRTQLGPGRGPYAYPSARRARLIRRLGSRRALGYDAWWDLPPLPKLNTDTPAVRRFLLDVARYWIARGADGWRLDVPGEIDDDAFWRAFRTAVKQTNPEAYIVGEVWTDAGRWLQGDQFDAVMNYVVTRACIGFFARESLDGSLAHAVGHGVQTLNAGQFADEIDRVMRLYDTEIIQAQLNLLGSHDTPRFLSLAGGDRTALLLAYTFIFTIPGAPCVYYGDEVGMTGGADPHCRRSFPARRAEWDTGLQHYLRALAGLRQRAACLRRGTFHRLRADGRSGVYAFARLYREEAAVVVLNSARRPRTLELKLSALGSFSTLSTELVTPTAGAGGGGNKAGRETAGAAAPQAQLHDGRLRVALIPARSAVIYRFCFTP